MYSIKGGWVGQTFALSSNTDLGGKKSRIRRSKEERKAMVESFIERYQKSNKGNFPSLSLTHKEVGGSYYIVRDIVRDIIQENRVLGSGRSSTDEHNDHSPLEYYPLGSISTEPQIHMFSSEESRVMTEVNHISTSESLSSNRSSYEHEGLREKDIPVLNSNPSVFGLEPDESSTILSSTTDDDTREYEFLSSSEKMRGPTDMQSVSEDTITRYKENVPENESEELFQSNALPVYNEVSSIDHLQSSIQVSTLYEVEISAGDDISNGSNQPSSNYKDCKENNKLEAQVQESKDDMKYEKNEQEVKDLPTEIEAKVVVETFPLSPVPNNIHFFDQGLGESHGTTNHVEENTEEDKSNSLHDATVSTKKEDQATEEPIVKAAPSDSTKGILAINDTADTSGASAGIKLNNAPKGFYHDNLIAAGAVDSPKKISPPGTTTRNSKVNVQHESNSKKRSNPTLNRINLETWEGRSKPDANPLLALLKSFITSFVKFWTE